MSIPATMEDDINNGLQLQRSHRNLNNSTIIRYSGSGEQILIPSDSIVNKYYDFFIQYAVETEMTEFDQSDYRYAPKKFSNDMYGTTQYWSLILYLNDCHSVLDFNLTKIRYVAPEKIEDIINEIMILEKKN